MLDLSDETIGSVKRETLKNFLPPSHQDTKKEYDLSALVPSWRLSGYLGFSATGECKIIQFDQVET